MCSDRDANSLIPFGYAFAVGRPLSLREEVIDWLKPDYPDYEIVVGLDRNYSSGK